MKNYLLIIVLFLLSQIGFAQKRFEREQNIIPKNTQLGFTLSPNIGWMRVTNLQNYKTNSALRAGFSYGVLADFGFDRNYFFSTAFIVTSINVRLTCPDVADIIPTTYNLQYIEIPLTLKLKTNPTNYGRIYGQFGLGTSVKISGKETGGSIEGPINYAINTGNTFRASLIIGAGVEWKIGSGLYLQTGLTLNHGLTNAISTSNYNVKSDYLSLNLGLFF